MKKLNQLFALALSISLVGCTLDSSLALAKNNQVPAQTNQQLATQWMQYLASDTLMGRKTGSPQMEEVQAWLVSTYQDIGIQKLPNAKSYLQTFLAETGDGQLAAANVLGYLPCNCDSDKFIIIGAHYDHIGHDPSLENDQIFNGADDDASGVVTSLIIAKQLAKQKKLPVNVIIAAWDAEEIGLQGSKYYVKNPLVPLEQLETGFMFELVGTMTEPNKAWMTGSHYSSLFSLLKDELGKRNWQLGDDPFIEQGLFMRSDNAPFALMDINREKMVKVFREKQKVDITGLPVHAISVWNGQDHYHKVNDDISVINIPNMTSLAEAIADVILHFPEDISIEWQTNAQFNFSKP